MKRFVLTILTISWMSLIFIFSNQKAVVSLNTSDSFIDKTVVKIYRLFDGDVNKEKDIKELFSRPVRKLAHFTVYFILGLLVLYTLKSYDVKDFVLYTILICFLYAASDEVHQLFIVGRSGEALDICLDTLASTLSVLLAIIFKKVEYNGVSNRLCAVK